MFIQCKENKLLNKELSIDNSKSILNKKIVSNNKLIIFNYSKPTYILFNIIFIVIGFMTLIKMSYIADEGLIGLILIVLNFISILGICIFNESLNDQIHTLFHFLFFYLTLILVILIFSCQKKYSVDKLNLLSIILFSSILIFNLFVVANNAYLLCNSEIRWIQEIKNNNKWYFHIIFLNIFKQD